MFYNCVAGTNRVGLRIGSFTSRIHTVSGILFALNETVLFIKDFNFDGQEKAVFLAGKSGSLPSDRVKSEIYILPYPFEGRFYEYDAENVPHLGRYSNDDLVLNLPDGVEVRQLKWLSVWSKQIRVNFGEVIWPKNQDAGEDMQGRNNANTVCFCDANRINSYSKQLLFET